MKPSSPKRLDLQGIRAFAVVAVVVFHFFPSLLPFGFLGVDVFFVLSGFLISLVLSKASTRSFSTYTTFYFNRLRRIFPLFLLVVAVIVTYIVVHHQDQLLFYNCRSAVFALFFVSNIRAQDKGEDYFRLLEKSTDLFTHTWSLAVEIQFYLLAPIVIHLPKFFLGPRSSLFLPFLSMISSLSLVYHGSSPSNVAFNSTLARLWQFLAGAIVFHIRDSWAEAECARRTGEDYKECLLETENGEGSPPPRSRLAHNTTSNAWSLVFPILALIVLWNDFSLLFLTRVGVTYATALLILVHMRTPLLNHQAVVAVGNLSYGLYLVHWPVVCVLSEYQIASTWAKIVSIFLCFAVSFAIEIYYEAWYLRLNVPSTLLLVFALYSLCFGVLIAREFAMGEGGIPLDVPDIFNRHGQSPTWSSTSLSHPDTRPPVVPSTDLVAQLDKEWQLEMTRNISIGEALALNEKYENDWATNLNVKNCVMRKSNEENPWGLCDMPPGKGKLKFLVLGNSYAANHVGLVYKHFAHLYSTFQQHSVILNGCVGTVKAMEEEVAAEKPDVLFVIQRWIVMNTPIADVNNLDADAQFAEILEGVDAIGRNVSKVFVMHTLPRSVDIRAAIKKRARNKQDIPDYIPETIDMDDKWMRLRLEGVAERCKNCVIFDVIKRHLNSKGEYTVAHPHTHIIYNEHAKHHTPYGLRLIEPVFAGMARDFDKLMHSSWPENVYSL